MNSKSYLNKYAEIFNGLPAEFLPKALGLSGSNTGKISYTVPLPTFSGQHRTG